MSVRIEPDVVVDIAAPREEVFAILADGWNYPNWVVGASHVRAVDRGWPEPGTRIHHSTGPWPLHIEDVTEVVVVDRPRLLVLHARLWPVGSARVRLELEERGEDRTRVEMTERAMRGPISLAPFKLQSRVLTPRNRESLYRLADLAVGRSVGVGPGDAQLGPRAPISHESHAVRKRCVRGPVPPISPRRTDPVTGPCARPARYASARRGPSR